MKISFGKKLQGGVLGKLVLPLSVTVLAAVLTFSLVSCNGDDDTSNDTDDLSATGIELNKTEISVETGKSVELTATLIPQNSDSTITWKATKGSATVNLSAETGASISVTGDSIDSSAPSGTATVTATANGKTATCTITVLDANAVFPEGISLDPLSFTVDMTEEEPTMTKTVTATLTGENISEGAKTIIWTSSNENIATVSASDEDSKTATVTATGTVGSATITAKTINGKTATMTVTVTGGGVIALSDTPTGYAGYGYTTSPYYTGSNTITINATDSNAASTLKDYAKKGNYVIYINGIIDVTEGMLPSAWDNDNAKLGDFISKNKGSYSGNAITSWSAWRQAYGAFCTQTGNNSDYNSSTAQNATDLNGYQYALVTAWKKQIQIVMASNTTIIGLTNESGIKGGNISISGVSNVMIRNLHLQDAFDPFPHHETSSGKTDGWNAEYDCITIQNTNKYIWIDHCTFEDTISVGWKNFAGVKTGSNVAAKAYSTSDSEYEMWQTYDGLCDIKGTSSNITVSYCVFKNHDKTMLVGNSDSESVTASDRTITLHHNYYYGCVQRLPMARLSYIHNFNNYYGVNSANGYDQKAAVNARKGVYINSESNYFDSGMKYSYNSSDSTAYLYYKNDAGTTASQTSLSGLSTSTTTPVFTVPYDYSEYLDSASNLKSTLEDNAGAGVWKVRQ